jgi:hypothetical protein
LSETTSLLSTHSVVAPKISHVRANPARFGTFDTKDATTVTHIVILSEVTDREIRVRRFGTFDTDDATTVETEMHFDRGYYISVWVKLRINCVVFCRVQGTQMNATRAVELPKEQYNREQTCLRQEQ